MNDKGAPGVRRYHSTHQEEGYLFTVFVNDEKECVYEEIANYTEFKGLRLI